MRQLALVEQAQLAFLPAYGGRGALGPRGCKAWAKAATNAPPAASALPPQANTPSLWPKVTNTKGRALLARSRAATASAICGEP